MALFRRNKTDDTTVMPEEVTSYYEAENRERTWMAWLLALVTLAITAIIIIALFFGGRWVYRKLRHKPSTTTSVVTQKPATESPKTTTPTTDSAPSSPPTNTSPSNGNVNAPTSPSTSSNTPSTGTTSTPPPSTPAPAATTNMPNTGPGDMLGVFAVVSVAAYVLHRRWQRQ